MLIKIIWTLIGLNIVALLIFIGGFFVTTSGKNVDYQEKGWTIILASLGLLFILLAALPPRFSHSTFTVGVSGFFAALPLVIAVCMFLSKRLPSFKKKETMAEIYYSDKTQRSIAAAIEQNDTLRLKELIKGQDLNIQGNRVWDWDGLNYLQFAIRLRSNPNASAFNDEANTAAIHLLIANGCATTPALADAAQYLPLETFSLLLEAGADPNTRSFAYNEPLLFQVIGTTKRQNDIAIMLIRKGAAINAKNRMGYTPVMFAANNAGTSENWNNVWRVVRFLLTEAHADYRFTPKDGSSLQSIITNIRGDAAANKITMPEDFLFSINWLKQQGIDTDPVPMAN